MRVVVRRDSDGALALVLRSVDLPDCHTPSGYTRVDVECGGYVAIPTGPENMSTYMKYGMPRLDPFPPETVSLLSQSI